MSTPKLATFNTINKTLPKALKLVMGIMLMLWCFARVGLADPGELDKFGGHIGENGSYHYHKPKFNLTQEIQKRLQWSEATMQGELSGIVLRVDSPKSFWIKIDHPPTLAALAEIASANDIDQRQGSVRVWLKHIGTEVARLRGAKFYQQFNKQAVHEIQSFIMHRLVTVKFKRMAGKILLGTVIYDKIVLNEWIIGRGLSFYVLDGEKPLERYRLAESHARKNKLGLWKK